MSHQRQSVWVCCTLSILFLLCSCSLETPTESQKADAETIQGLAILSRFVEPQDYTLQHIQYNGWAAQAVQTAVAYGWIEDSMTIKPDALISRGQLEELLNYVLVQYR